MTTDIKVLLYLFTPQFYSPYFILMLSNDSFLCSTHRGWDSNRTSAERVYFKPDFPPLSAHFFHKINYFRSEKLQSNIRSLVFFCAFSLSLNCYLKTCDLFLQMLILRMTRKGRMTGTTGIAEMTARTGMTGRTGRTGMTGMTVMTGRTGMIWKFLKSLKN